MVVVLVYAIVAAVWSGAWIVSKVAVAHVPPLELSALRFTIAGLALLFGLQSSIAMAVNLHLLPAKGMTLPFISYGGSSLISLAYGMGMLVALTRRRPRAEAIAELEHKVAQTSAHGGARA